MVSWVNHKIVPDVEKPPDNAPNYAEDLSRLLATYLMGPPEAASPGEWILKGVQHPFKSGFLVFFLSEYDGIYVFCNTQSTSGRNYLYCFLCPRSRSCSHISLTPSLDHIEQNPNPSNENESHIPPPMVNEADDSLVSKERYPFDLDGDEPLRKVIFARTFTPLAEWYEANVSEEGFIAEIRECCSTQCEIIRANPQSSSAEIFSLHGYAVVEPIQATICRTCHTRYEFDGRSMGILNYANRYLFTVELILDLLEFKAISGTPTYSYWQARNNTMLKAWKKEDTAAMKKSWMNMAGRVNGIMTAYLSLVDYPADHFQCCENPEVVCIDGIVLSVESRRINTTTPWVDPHVLRDRFTIKEERYIAMFNASQKQLLKDFIRNGIIYEDLEQLASEIVHTVGIFMLRNCIPDKNNPQLVCCPPLLKRFYQSLYKWISPASSIAPSCTWDMIREIVIYQKIPFEYINRIAELSPVLLDLVLFISTTIGDDVKFNIGLDLLNHIHDKAKDCYLYGRQNYHNPISAVSESKRVPFTSPMQEVLETGAYFPGRPYCSIVRDIQLTNDATTCNKLYKKQGRLGAGTLLFWCGIHRKCLGFYVMKSAESCKTVFQILVTRFKKQPRVIIYDNGCNLSEYILNRAPGPFQDTYILSDGFHWKNHTNCGVSFNSKLYPALDGIVC